MSKTISQFAFAAVLFGMMISVGCGGSSEPKEIVGVTDDFLAEIEAGQQGYAQSMQKESKKKPGQ